MALNTEREAEISALAARYGEPRRVERIYRVGDEELARWIPKLRRRTGEIVLVVPRPGGRYLVHTKSFYPDLIFRLPSGGIDPGERIEEAAHREIVEELGQPLNLVRLLAIVDNSLLLNGQRTLYPSYVFLTERLETEPHPIDQGEDIAAFKDVTRQELGRLAEELHSLGPGWKTWGQFRAVPHELAVELLSKTTNGG